jgi:hypothetical protein
MLVRGVFPQLIKGFHPISTLFPPLNFNIGSAYALVDMEKLKS